jgi:hypothetical protein
MTHYACYSRPWLRTRDDAGALPRTVTALTGLELVHGGTEYRGRRDHMFFQSDVAYPPLKQQFAHPHVAHCYHCKHSPCPCHCLLLRLTSTSSHSVLIYDIYRGQTTRYTTAYCRTARSFRYSGITPSASLAYIIKFQSGSVSRDPVETRNTTNDESAIFGKFFLYTKILCLVSWYLRPLVEPSLADIITAHTV